MAKRAKAPINLLFEQVKSDLNKKKEPAASHGGEQVFSDGDNSVAAIVGYRPSIRLSFSIDSVPYGIICERYGITVKGGALERLTGYYRSNYNNAKKGKRKISAGEMIAACLLSGLTVQKTADAFHECKDVHEIAEYGYAAATLCIFLDDLHTNGIAHTYEELISTTVSAYIADGFTELPRQYRRQRWWIAEFTKQLKE